MKFHLVAHGKNGSREWRIFDSYTVALHAKEDAEQRGLVCRVFKDTDDDFFDYYHNAGRELRF